MTKLSSLRMEGSGLLLMRPNTTILITGTQGMLGSVLSPILEKDFAVIRTDKKTLDITDGRQVKEFMDDHTPTIVIHLAAITNLELCEENHTLAEQVNVEGTRNLIEAIDTEKTTFVYLSTDAVYDSERGSMDGFLETDTCNPPNYYGFTKWKGEQLVQTLPHHYILRTTWLYGGPEDKKFLSKVLPKVEKKEPVSIVNDVYGSPTSTFDLSHMIKDILTENAPFGIYNAVNSGSGSRLDMILRAATTLNLDTTVIKPVSSEIFPQTLTRHQYAILNNEKFSEALYRPREWQEALTDYLLTYYSQD